MAKSVFQTQLPGLTLKARGKVRDIYDLGEELLIVSTDRISAFDSVLPTPIPGKGRILTALSEFWFEFLGGVVKNHIITTDLDKMGHGLSEHRQVLEGRSMLVRKARVVPIECVARGYLMGTGFKEYQTKSHTVCGIQLPAGLTNGSKLPQFIFTPSTKAKSGHDENISFEQAISQAVELMGVTQERARQIVETLRQLTLSLYTKAYEHALGSGIIIADTKFEFGLVGDEIILIDEVLTPDSSRFWPKAAWTPGKSQLSFDKQFVRDYLEGIGWDKNPPAPELPEKVVSKTREKYIEAYRQITGRDLDLA